MKKIRMIVCYIIVIMLVLSFAPTAFAEGARGGAVTTVVSNVVKMAGGRAAQELSAYSIANDVPVLGDLFYFFCDPGQRAELEHKATVNKIYSTVQEIKSAIEVLDSKLENLQNIIETNHAESIFYSAKDKIDLISAKYTTAQSKYEIAVKAINDYANASEETKASYEAIASAAIKDFVAAVDSNSLINFENDLANLNNAVYKSGDSTTYLPALENYLREAYPFEHMITEKMYDGFELTENLQLQIFNMYREYVSFKQTDESVSDADKLRFAAYNDEYFSSLYSTLVSNINTQAEASGLGSLMLEKPFTDEELSSMFGSDIPEDLPEAIQTKVHIRGTEYPAYKLLANEDMTDYYVINSLIGGSSAVEKTSVSYKHEYSINKNTSTVYRPVFTLDDGFLDDGTARLISSKSDISFAGSYEKLITQMRSSWGLTDIPQSTDPYLILRGSKDDVDSESADVTWQMKYHPAENMSGSTKSVSSKDVYNGSYPGGIAIFKSTTCDNLFADGVWKVTDKGEIEGKVITLHDGQTLDISGITVNMSDITIIISGSGHIISNSAITLNDSAVIIKNTDIRDDVSIKNLNVKARPYQKAALMIESYAGVEFDGANSFTGNSYLDPYGRDGGAARLYANYPYGEVAFASHGISVDNGAELNDLNASEGGERKVSIKAQGAGGGAGICNTGTLRVYNLIIEAYGSDLLNTNNIYTVGAGIGASVSVNYGWSEGSYFAQSSRIYSKGASSSDSFIADNCTIKAKGFISTQKNNSKGHKLGESIWSEDIGGVVIKNLNKTYEASSGGIENSTVTIENFNISDKISTKLRGNTFMPEKYTLTAYTKGSNGVTTDGVKVKLYGPDNTATDWIYFNDIGNSKGEHSQSVSADGFGLISHIGVMTNSSNHWYPGKIRIKSEFSGYSAEVYGGRWIGNTEKTLKLSDNVYEVTVNTADCSNAGTDSTIKMYLADSDGKVTDTIDLSDIHQDSNAFEKGDSDTFWIYAPQLTGSVEHVYLSSDHTNSGPGWKLDKFTVKKVQGFPADEGYTFESGQWFEKADTINFGKETGKTGSFYVEVKTKNVSNAGTDSNIYITLYGTKGNTGEIDLGTYAGSGDDFEKGNLDCFHIGCSVEAIGEINKITIRKDDSGPGPDWQPEYIEIQEEVSTSSTPQSIKFDLSAKTISEGTYTFENAQTVTRSVTRITKDTVKDLAADASGMYKIIVNSNVKVDKEAIKYMKESGNTYVVEMRNQDKPIFELEFDGSKIKNTDKDIWIEKDFSSADRQTKMAFLKHSDISDGLFLKIYLENLGIPLDRAKELYAEYSGGSAVLLAKAEKGSKTITAEVKGGAELVLLDAGTYTGNVPPTGDSENIALYFVLIAAAAAAIAAVFALKRKASEK